VLEKKTWREGELGGLIGPLGLAAEEKIG